MKTILLLLVLAAPVFAQQRTSTEPLLVRSDSLTGVPLQVAVRAIGTATIGAGDSVQVAIPDASSSDVVMISYAAAKSATADIATALSWRCVAEGALTIYGDESKTVIYMVIR